MTDLQRHILIIDDDEDIQAFLSQRLKAEGYQITLTGSAKEALVKTREQRFDVIISDLRMPELDGFELMGALKAEGIDTPIILVTAHGSVEAAISAMRNGAFDFVLKPINLNELKLSIERALKFHQLERDNTALRNEVRKGWQSGSIIGKSRPIRAVLELVTRVAPTNANVLVTGESGTGKELVARALHDQSPRAPKAFVAINCSAIPAELLESELFGHAKGSFTGAHQARKGLFEEAEGGTVFLDEIGDMEGPLQAKLLRVLQERKIKPVGDNKLKDIDVRIVAATHKDLRAAIKEGRFREDLYYRLCVIPIEIPALRNRKEDIPLLAEYFLRKHAANHSLNVVGFTPAGLAKLMNHPWEGNVRELENVIERSAILAGGRLLDDTDLPDLTAPASPTGFVEEKAGEYVTLRELERQYIARILRRTGGKKERAAHILGIDRKTLYRKEREYGLAQQLDEGSEAAEDGETPGLPTDLSSSVLDELSTSSTLPS